MPKSISIAIGNSTSPELRPAVEWLRAHEARFFENPAAALWQAEVTPRWIYLLCERRGVVAQAEVEALHRAWPLARLIAVCGSWCEGEPRSGKPLAGVHRAYGHQFLARASAADASDFAGWRLPRTATPIDVSLQRMSYVPLAANVGVIAQTRADFTALSDALQALGCITHWQRDEEAQVAAILWNGCSLNQAAEQELLSAREFQKPLIALLDSPRSQEFERALACGVAAVISKPFLLGDLYNTLAVLLSRGAHQRAA
jgi:hypothetical protein